MNTEDTSNTQQTAPALDITSENLSFTDYQKIRRGETVQASEKESAPELKTQEQNKSEESETTENEDEAGSELDESEEDSSDKPKKKGGFQRRIDKLNARVADRERELEYWKTQATKEAKSEPKEEPKVEAAKSDDEPDPENFETHKEYLKAVTKWTIEQDKKVSKQEEEKRKVLDEQDKQLKSHHEREKSFAEKTKDYAEVLKDANYLSDAPPTLAQLIVSSENGPELMYELAKNLEEYERIKTLGPLAVAREVGKLESRLSKSSEESKPEPKKITKAAAPINPVGGTKGTVTKSLDDPNLPFTEYVRMRREQMKKRA